jgi:small redox-active disulfide protein 2
MKKIQILGTGCAKCTRLADNAKTAADALGIEYELEKITGIDEIMKFGVMMTPALAGNGEVMVAGRVASVDELKRLLV